MPRSSVALSHVDICRAKNKMSHVTSGFRLTGLVLIGFVAAVMFFGGVIGLLFPEAVDRTSWTGRHTAVVTPIFLTVSIPIMLVTMNRWLKVMAGFLGLAVLNGLISLGRVVPEEP